MVASAKYERALELIGVESDTNDNIVHQEYLDQWEARLTHCLGEETANNPRELRRYLAKTLLELAGLEHYTFMPTVHYIYNDQNPDNEHKHLMPKIRKMHEIFKYWKL